MTTNSFTSTRGISTNRELSSDAKADNSSGSPYARSDEYIDERLAGKSSAPALDNATYIGVHEKDYRKDKSFEHLRKYERLELYNRGTHTRQGRVDQTQLHDQDDWYFCESLTAQMGLSDRECLLTWRVFKRLDMRSYRGVEPNDPERTMKQYIVAFCVGALVYNAGQSEDCWKYYPGKNYPAKSKRYQWAKVPLQAENQGDGGDRHRSIEQCAECVGFSEEEIRSCIEKVRTDLPAWISDS